MCLLKFRARSNSGKCRFAEPAHGKVGKAVRQQMDAARILVTAAHSLLKDPWYWPLIRPLYEKYFLTPLQAGEALNDILAGLVLTMNGLNNGIQVQVAKTIGLGKYDTGEAVAKVPEVNRTQPATGENFAVDLLSGKRAVMGDITMMKNLVLRKGNEGACGYQPVKTLIHEATHKFAGTIDYYYFSIEDGEVGGGYMGNMSGEAGTFGEAAHAKDGPTLARMNADSFGWFCYWAGGPRYAIEKKLRRVDAELSQARGPGGMIG